MAKKPKRTKAGTPPLREPRAWDVEAMKHAKKQYFTRRNRVEARVRKDENGHVRVEQPHSDQNGWTIQQLNAFGTTSAGFLNSEVMRLINVVCPGEIREERINAALAVVDGIQPRDEVEAMLAVQMAATHSLMMQMASNAVRSEMVNHLEAAGNLAVKLARTFTAQVEALAKLRKPPEQRVVVEHKHVHVHPGAQAVVGNVTHTGGGVALENGHQPHAPDEMRALELATGPAVWGEDASREPVPVASGEGEMPVPDARRGKGLRRAARPGERELSARPADAGDGGRAQGAAVPARRVGPDRQLDRHGSEDHAAA